MRGTHCIVNQKKEENNVRSHPSIIRSSRWRIRLSSSLVLVSFASSSPPECILVYIRGDFSCAQIDLRKARERELAALDEKSTSSEITEPYAR